MITEAKINRAMAEVRTLMIGNRQITETMINQLDFVPYNDMEVWGRVRLTDQTVIIGRSNVTGDLVLMKRDRRCRLHSDIYRRNGAQGCRNCEHDIAEKDLFARLVEQSPLIIVGGLT